MKKFRILEDVAIADIAIEAYGKDLDELFENCAFAIFEESADINKIEEKETKSIKLKAKNVEDLLFDFLSEILFLKDTYSMIFKKSNVKISGKNGGYELRAELTGEKIGREKHELRNDIKAITLHMFKVEKTKRGCKSTFVVDV